MRKDNLGFLMKSYESSFATRLLKKSPAIIRLDGKAFHTYTRNFERPFDDVFSRAMCNTMKSLCENIQSCVFAYTQSDEITLLLQDYKKENTAGWFDYKVQKMTSVSASMATYWFNKYFYESLCSESPDNPFHEAHEQSYERGAFFDSRAFNLPPSEVVNCFVWRQEDAMKNGVQSIARHFYTHKELQNVNTNDVISMLEKDNHKLDDYPMKYRRGIACYKTEINVYSDYVHSNIARRVWYVDENIPVFSEEPEYIERHFIFKD